MAGEGEAGKAPRLVSFVTESEVEAIRKKRQEQWEKVRKPGDPKGQNILIIIIIIIKINHSAWVGYDDTDIDIVTDIITK